MSATSFEPHRPRSIGEAVALAERYGAAASFLAGGTLLTMEFGRHERRMDHIILLDAIGELAGIDDARERVTVGAMTTLDDVARSPVFDDALQGVTDAARVIGGQQIKNIGTVGGNIAAGSAVSDLLPPFLALDGDVVLTGPRGERVAPVASLLLGGGGIDLHPGELITSVRLSRPAPGTASAYVKIGRRKAMEIAIVSVAARLTIDPASGLCRNARVAIGAVTDKVYRSDSAEEVLEQAKPVAGVFNEAGRLAAEAARPMHDIRASAWYRRRLVEALVPRALGLCAQRIGEAAAS